MSLYYSPGTCEWGSFDCKSFNNWKPNLRSYYYFRQNCISLGSTVYEEIWFLKIWSDRNNRLWPIIWLTNRDDICDLLGQSHTYFLSGFSSFRSCCSTVDDCKVSTTKEQEAPMAAMLIERSEWYMQTLYKKYIWCCRLSFSSFCPVVLEEMKM